METFAKQYEALLSQCLNNPEYIVSPRGQKVHELTNVMMTIDPLDNGYINSRRSSQFKYIASEMVWYFTGDHTSQYITKHAKFWDSIKNVDGTVNSAYGWQLFKDINEHGFSEWDWALHSLIEDTDTRQAIMKINKPIHNNPDTNDYPCTLSVGFMIRDNKLNCTVHMRSNDLILGLPTDIAFFTVLHQQMLRHIKEYEFNTTVELGKYVHIVDSMHLYSRNFEVAESMLGYADFKPAPLPVLDIDLINTDSIPRRYMHELRHGAVNYTESEFITWLNTQLWQN